MTIEFAMKNWSIGDQRPQYRAAFLKVKDGTAAVNGDHRRLVTSAGPPDLQANYVAKGF